MYNRHLESQCSVDEGRMTRCSLLHTELMTSLAYVRPTSKIKPKQNEKESRNKQREKDHHGEMTVTKELLCALLDFLYL